MDTRFKEGHGFKDLVGNKYGLLTILEYVGKDKHKRSKWKCQCECGNIVEEFGAEMKQGSVKSCGCTLTKPRPKRVDRLEFLRRAEEVHGDAYDYSKVEYKNTTTAVEIVCRKHDSFWQTPTQHYIKGQGCAKCAYEAKSRDKRSNTETFISEARVRNGGDFDYSLVDYVDSKTQVDIICNKCKTVFSQRADVHLRGNGCFACAIANMSENYKVSTPEYIEKAEKVYPNGEYDYKNTEYTFCKNRINVFCNMCNQEFSIRADTHLRGHGCPCKATHGFDFTRPGTLYILECGEITKIGITSHRVSRRIRDISRDYGQNFELVSELLVENPRVCSDVETILLRELRSKYKQPEDKFDGYTECFFNVDQASLLNRIAELIEEHDD